MTDSTDMNITLYLNEIFNMFGKCLWQFHVAIPALLNISVEALTQSGTYVGVKLISEQSNLFSICWKLS